MQGLRPTVLAAVLFLGSVATAAHAQSNAPGAARAYDVPSQPLGATLTRIAEESGERISIDSELVRGLSSPAVQGNYTAEQAAQQALINSGLQLTRTGSGTLTVRRAEKSKAGNHNGASALPEVTVSGKAPGSTTEGSGSYTAFSTSSSTRLNLTSQETPQSITVLTRQLIDDQKLGDLTDALGATPGVVVQNATVGQDAPYIYARGVALSNYQVDGIPRSSTMGPHLENTSMYDRIEVVRGATGIMNGIGSPAATINMIRKRPTAERQMSVTAQAGTWDRYGAGFDLSGAANDAGTVRLRLVGDAKNQHAWSQNYAQKSQSLYGVAEVDLTSQTLLTVGLNHLTQDTQAPILGQPLFYTTGARLMSSPSGVGFPSWTYFDNTVSTGFASIEHRFNQGWIGKIEYSHSQFDYDAVGYTPSLNTITPTGSGFSISPYRWNSKLKQDTVDAYVSGSFALLGHRHELIAGVSSSSLKTESPSYTRVAGYPTALNFNDLANAAAPSFTRSSTLSTTEEKQNSIFISSRLSVTDATTLLLGGRMTNYRYSNGRAASERDDNVFIPYAGIVQNLNDTWSLFASYTKIYKPQSYWVSVINGLTADPEEGVGYEAGVKGSFFDGKLNSSFSVFQTDRSNLAVWSSAISAYQILGETQSRGVELELNGELAKNWQIGGGYAFALTKDMAGAQLLTEVPRHTLKVFTSYRLPGEWSQLTVGGGVSWQNSTSNGGSPYSYQQGGVGLVNLMARYTLDRNLTLSLNVNNALDKQYYSYASGNRATFGAPRNVIVSMKYDF
jgi:TonB-dependent siderophore receptor